MLIRQAFPLIAVQLEDVGGIVLNPAIYLIVELIKEVAEPSSAELVAVFRAYGVMGEVKEVVPRAQDEAVFVVTAPDSSAVDNRDLALALQTMLARKVWVVPDAPTWEHKTIRL